MKSKFCFAFLLLVFSIPQLRAQDDKFKALFMYNFTKYLEWPSNKHSGDFIIGIYGNSPIITELNIIAQKRKVGQQTIVVKRFNEASEVSACHILFIPENRSSKIEEVINMLNSSSGVVIITDKEGLANTYAGINYAKVNGKQNFEINRRLIQKYGVQVNSALLSLGINIEN